MSSNFVPRHLYLASYFLSFKFIIGRHRPQAPALSAPRTPPSGLVKGPSALAHRSLFALWPQVPPGTSWQGGSHARTVLGCTLVRRAVLDTHVGEGPPRVMTHLSLMWLRWLRPEMLILPHSPWSRPHTFPCLAPNRETGIQKVLSKCLSD